jgi:diguanylate cyclase (GGDEF)-like protein
VTVLVVSNDREATAGLLTALSRAPARAGHAAIVAESADRLSVGLARLAAGGVDVVLLELALPDARPEVAGGDDCGLEALVRVRRHAPDVPVVVLTGLDDEELALHAIQAGAQDYLLTGRVTPEVVLRVVRYARERHRLQRELHDLALTDPLTGLRNRRGFAALGEQPFALARRTGRGLVLLAADLDGLKGINDRGGHQAGDRALTAAAAALASTFRKTDVVARLGGDEFAVLAVDTPPDGAVVLTARLHAALERHNAAHPAEPPLALSVGCATLDDGPAASLDALLARADAALYAAKRAARAAGV